VADVNKETDSVEASAPLAAHGAPVLRRKGAAQLLEEEAQSREDEAHLKDVKRMAWGV
jgi:hypothetical protein